VTKNAILPPAEKEDWISERAEELYNCGDRGGKLLCELAQVPNSSKDQFLNETRKILSGAFLGHQIIIRNTEVVGAVERFETALRGAYSAFLLIPEEYRHLFHFFEVRPDDGPLNAELVVRALRREDPWDYIFRRMIRKCADYTGRRPTVIAQRGRGRRKGSATRDTYPLRNFVWKLARTVRRHGGHLTLYAKEQRGTWIDALNGLRPLYPEGFIPKVLPVSMIEEVQAKANKLPL
jgi:hypothetical protein